MKYGRFCRSALAASISLAICSFATADEAERDGITSAIYRSAENARGWFDELSKDVLNHNPADNPIVAEMDRLASVQSTAIEGARKELAERDKRQSYEYITEILQQASVGEDDAKKLTSWADSEDFIKLYTPIYYAHRLYDEGRGRYRRVDYNLKDRFKRGRPYQVLDENRQYKADFRDIKGSSFPSGHTWDGYENATVYTWLLPERGREIFSRAIQYGESRAIVNAHFPSDTIGSRAANYFYIAKILEDDETTKSIVQLAKELRDSSGLTCDKGPSLRDCLLEKADPLADEYAANNHEIGYYGMLHKEGISKVDSHEIPFVANNILRIRFPYLTPEQRRDILASTAYPKNSLAADAADQNWGLINLPEAYNGISRLDQDWVVDQRVKADEDVADFGAYDIWRNNITGPGTLTKTGDGVLELRGHNQFGGLNVDEGILLLSGKNNLTDSSQVNDGQLTLLPDAYLGNTLYVNGGVLNGNGTAENVHIRDGGTIAPGQSIGTLSVGDITFESGSTYHLEIDDKGNSDQIQASGEVHINGGTLALYNLTQARPLNKEDHFSLDGQRYTIMTADRGITGTFTKVEPGYIFYGAQILNNGKQLDYKLGRNHLTFSDFTVDINEKNIANALGNPKKSTDGSTPLGRILLNSQSEAQIKNLLSKANGQVYAENNTARVDSSLYINETIGELLANDQNQNINIQLLSQRGHYNTRNGLSGFDRKDNGLLISANLVNMQNAKFGVSAAYTKSDTSGSHGSSESRNYHAGIYGKMAFEPVSLSAVLSHSEQKSDITRGIYQSSPRASTTQLSAKAEMPVTEVIGLFAKVDLLHDKQHSASEGSDLTALNLNASSENHSYSTIGLTFNHTQDIGKGSLAFNGSIGWQHLLHGRSDSYMNLSSGSNVFVQNAVRKDNNQLALQVGADWTISPQHTLSLSYMGDIGKNNHDNSIRVGYRYSF